MIGTRVGSRIGDWKTAGKKKEKIREAAGRETQTDRTTARERNGQREVIGWAARQTDRQAGGWAVCLSHEIEERTGIA